MENLHVTYIGHSGFLVETADCYYIFDYYMGELPTLSKEKPVFVFASHAHPDHYNPAIFEKLAAQGIEQVTAVLSKDIPKKKYPTDFTDNSANMATNSNSTKVTVLTVTFHQEYDLAHETKLFTLLSTDKGVAFLLTCPYGTLYHAGDLNDWVWAGESDGYNRQMTGSYHHEIDLLKEYLKGRTVDIAFVPLDPRQEKDYDRGMLYFLKKIPVNRVYPMHYWGKPAIIEKFSEENPQYADVIQDTEACK